MGHVKDNIYITQHFSEGEWESFFIGIHRGSESYETNSPQDDNSAHYSGLKDASATQTAFDSYIANNMDSAFELWYDNLSTTRQEYICEAFSQVL